MTPTRSVADQLWELAWPWRRLIAAVTLLVVFVALVQLAPPLIMREIVDHHLALRKGDGLVALALLYLGAVGCAQALTSVYGYLAAVIAQGVLDALRNRLFAHLVALPMAYHDRTALGDSISRCTADVDTVDTLFSTGVSTLVANLVFVVTAGGAMVALSPQLAAVAGLALPPLVIVTRYFKQQVRSAERESRVAIGRMNAHLQEGLGGVEVLRAFGREAAFARRFRRTLLATLVAANRSTFYAARYAPVMAFLSAVATALLLVAGMRATFIGWGVTTGTLTAFVLLFGRFFKPIIELGDQWQTVQSALSGAERIFQVLAVPLEVHAAEATPAPGGPAIDVAGVTFGYAPDRPVVRAVSFTVRAGEQVALVGRTGAGKTSVLHLVAGLYAPWSGAVRVAGVDPRGIPEAERSRRIGVVPQIVQLFSGAVLANLTLGDPAVPRADVEAAARAAGIDALVRSWPSGYDTALCGAGRGPGVRLSAGEQQLIALARALVFDPAVLLLDEATSTVDAASEAAFRVALDRLVRERGKAVLTIAHRLATARAADRVILMDDGVIVEEGAPDRLIAQGGRFARWLELEAGGWDWRVD